MGQNLDTHIKKERRGKMKIKVKKEYIEGRKAIYITPEIYIGVFEPDIVYSLPDALAEFLLNFAPSIFEIVQEEEEGQNG